MSKPIAQQTRITKANAFSLFELVIVISIVGTMAAIAIPRYQNSLTRYRAERSARVLAADLSAARIVAKTSNASRTATFDLAADRYQISGGTGGTLTRNLSESPYRADLISADFSGLTQVIFDPYGQVDNGGTVVIQAGSNQRTITVNADTGAVTVQ